MKQLQHGGAGGVLGVRFESQRFRLLSIVVDCFLISVTFLLSSRPESTAFDTRTLLPSPAGFPALLRASGHLFIVTLPGALNSETSNQPWWLCCVQ